MTLTQILLFGLCFLCVGLLLGLFGMFVLAWRIDKAFDEMRDFPVPDECKYVEKKKGKKK